MVGSGAARYGEWSRQVQFLPAHFAWLLAIRLCPVGCGSVRLGKLGLGTAHMDYSTYIKSKEWKEKREERLRIDGYRCVICKGSDNLEVHHLHYESLTNEDPLHDLITVCSGQCHRYFDTIERYQRYQKRQRRVEAIDSGVKERKDIQYGMESIAVQVNVSVRSVDAQRADRRPNKQMVEITQDDFVKTRQDR